MIISIEEDNIKVKVGSSNISIGSDSIDMESNDINIKSKSLSIASKVAFIGTITSNGVKIDSLHTHSGVQNGRGNTLFPNP